jgi:hypothetical protein
MHMATLTRRLQILLDEDRYRRLERAAVGRGAPVAAVVREAIDRYFGVEQVDRRAAGDRLLGAELMEVGEWSEMKRRLAEEMSGVGSVG